MRQYALKERALILGWETDQIDVIDEDLGQSGTSAERRSGFQELTQGVGNGRVGAIFALEVSRLTRSSIDWHRLLQLCSLADVLIMDEQSIYNASDHNDRLLLGLKGTMNEAEQYWMRLRLQGGKLSKARRGELYFRPAPGYQWDKATSRFCLDPDDEARRAIALVFERFRVDGSSYRVAQYFLRNKIALPTRNVKTNEVEFGQARQCQVSEILKNPVYAGTYAYGRQSRKISLTDGKIKSQTIRRSDPNSFTVCLHNHHPAYISWDEFMINQRKLQDNRTNLMGPQQRGASRDGSALLQGIALCGKCGHRMSTHYQGRYNQAQYQCMRLNADGVMEICFDVSATSIDATITELLFEAVQPPEVDMSLAVSKETERQASQLEGQWKIRLEKLRYEALLAEKRYKVVDPDNRVVARNLESEWNQKLIELQEAESAYKEARRSKKVELDENDCLRLLALGKDLRSLWLAPSTSNTERKNLLRLAIQQVTLSPVDIPAHRTRVQVMWQGGAVTDLLAERPNKYSGSHTREKIVELIKQFFDAKMTDDEMVIELNKLGFKTGLRLPWHSAAVRTVRLQNKLHRPPGGRGFRWKRPDGQFTVNSLMQKLGVSKRRVRSWINDGLIEPIASTSNLQMYQIDDATYAKLEDLTKIKKEHLNSPKLKEQRKNTSSATGAL
jgi:DNA invertase Pin-like site-specific DNA recombinase